MCPLLAHLTSPHFLIGPLNSSGSGDCLKSQEEEGVSSIETPTEEENGHGERLGLLAKEVGDPN